MTAERCPQCGLWPKMCITLGCPARCDVVTGMNRNAIQDFVTCGQLLPCPLHPSPNDGPMA